MDAVKPLRTEADYEAALARIEQYFLQEPSPGSPEADDFDLLALVIKDYEEKHWPVEPIDPPEMLRMYMELHGRTQSDLAQVLGSKSRASDVLNRRRSLTMEQARRLHQEWQIPSDVLLRPYALQPPNRRHAGASANRTES